jgi:DNA end-binding protein Ku
MIEPRGAGMVLVTLRAAEEVRAPAFATADTDIDADMVTVASMILKRRSGHFDPASFRDRYQEALRELIEAKMKGLPVSPKEIAKPRPVVDLMAALKRSLAQETRAPAKSGRKTAGDRRQTSLLLPVAGKKENVTSAPAAAVTARPRRRKA